jgi:activator of HSP90 ATPase
MADAMRSHLDVSISRRQAITGIALALGSLAAASSALGDPQEAATEAPVAPAAPPRTSLHYEADFKVEAQRIYHVLLDSKLFAEMTRLPAVIDPTEGGAFSMFDGRIIGRNVELIASQRIVQAWRPTHWDAGIYSIVRFELSVTGPQTHLTLDHTGFPPAEANNLNSGWKGHYLGPMAKFLV